MRVITGTCRGRRLLEPVGRDVRPTADQVKEAMFNIIQFDVEGRKVLDLFAGTGQLGIEALSRGAADCLFVDSARDSVRLVQENLRRCGLARSAVRRARHSEIRREIRSHFPRSALRLRAGSESDRDGERV